MNINSEQLSILESFVCQRLSSDSQNIRLVDDFSNHINDAIAQTLKNEAYEEDESNSTAYYVVKHPDGQILFFFSLKCGLLFDYFINPDLLSQLQKLAKELNEISDDSSLTPQQKRDITDVMEKIRSNAADKSKEEKLVRYYESQLNFIKPDELATAKPFYDFTCKFMCHETSTLEQERMEFFANFNPNPDDV